MLPLIFTRVLKGKCYSLNFTDKKLKLREFNLTEITQHTSGSLLICVLFPIYYKAFNIVKC